MSSIFFNKELTFYQFYRCIESDLISWRMRQIDVDYPQVLKRFIIDG